MIQAFREILLQKRRLLIVLAALLLLNIGLYAVINVYLAPKIITSQDSWNSLRQKVAVAGRSDVAAVYRRGIDDLKKLMTKVPPRRQFPRVLGEILDNAATSGVASGAITYKPLVVKGQDELLAYTVSMTVSGSYAAVKSFLGDLQKNSELVVIEGVSLSNSDLYEENVVLDLHLIIYLQSREGA